MSSSFDHDCSPIPPLSSISLLYRHVLESVFAFCTLDELTFISKVSYHWNSTAAAMPPLRALLAGSDERLLRFVENRHSRLNRHISQLIFTPTKQDYHGRTVPVLALFSQLAVELPHIICLECSIQMVPNVSSVLRRFRHLTSLNLSAVSVSIAPLQMEWIHQLTQTIGEIDKLATLKLSLPVNKPEVRFNALAKLSSLRSFDFQWNDQSITMTEEQMDDLQSMTQLHSLQLRVLRSDQLCRLLRSPHSFRLQSIQPQSQNLLLDTASANALCTLPSLTELDARLMSSCAHVNFLSCMIYLRRLDLQSVSEHGGKISGDQLMEGLLHCTQLIDLRLSRLPMTHRHLNELLPILSNLIRISLSEMTELKSLEGFNNSTLARSLIHLSIARCYNCPLSEVIHLHGLRSLQSLRLDLQVGVESLSAELRLPFTPPSALFPNLLTFHSA